MVSRSAIYSPPSTEIGLNSTFDLIYIYIYMRSKVELRPISVDGGEYIALLDTIYIMG